MAGKEATVYVVDVGASMGLKRHGRNESDLEWGLKYVWDKIATEVNDSSIRGLMNPLTGGSGQHRSQDS